MFSKQTVMNVQLMENQTQRYCIEQITKSAVNLDASLVHEPVDFIIESTQTEFHFEISSGIDIHTEQIR